MVTVGLLATLNAKSGKEDELASFLESALPLAQAEDDTVAWFATRSTVVPTASSMSFQDQRAAKPTSMARSPQH
jgi:hypothetical protein